MQKKLLLALSLALLLVTGCFLDNPTETNFPSWTVTLEVPLTQQTFLVSDLLDDSTFTRTDYDGESLYALNKDVNIDTTRVGNQLQVDDISQNFSQTVNEISVATTSKTAGAEIGKISLADIGPIQSGPFAFDEIMPSDVISDLQAAITAGGGSATVDSIPGADLEPVSKSFSFDSFSSATFDQGSIDITVTNNMIIDLGKPFQIYLVDNTGTEVDSVVFSEYIPKNGGSNTQNLDLTGKTLDNINSIKVDGQSDGSQGQSVTIESEDLDKGFTVDINGTNMIVTSAIAEVPAQTIPTRTDTVQLQESDNKITAADISSGSLNIEVDNQIALGADITLTINNLKDAGNNPFQHAISVNANGSVSNNPDLSAYTLVMPDTAHQQLEYEYSVATQSTGGSQVEVQENDSIKVDLSLANLTFSSVTGYFAHDAIVKTDTVSLQTDHTLQSALFDQGDLVITMTNNMGVEADVGFNITELKDAGGQSFAASFSLPNLGQSSTQSYSLENYNLEMSGADQQLQYESSITIPSDQEMTINFEDSIGVDFSLTGVEFESITGVISPITIELDSISQELPDFPEELQSINLQDVNLTLDFISSITDLPILMDLSITGSNSSGETETISVSGWNINADSDSTFDAAPLINLFPDAITATGQVTIGDGVQSTTITQNAYATGTLNIHAPFIFNISGDISPETEPQLVEPELGEEIDNIESMSLYIESANHFLFGASLEVLAARDTNSFHFASGFPDPDTLGFFSLEPGTESGPSIGLDSLVLDKDQIDLFSEPLYIKTAVTLLGQPDNEPSKIRSTDSLSVTLYGSAKLINDFLVSDEEEESQ